MLWLLQQVNHGDMKIKKKQWIVVLADFLPFYKPLNKCKREWGGGVACHTGAKLWSQIPSCIIYIPNLTLDLCIFKTIFLLGFFVADFVIFLTLLSNISPAPSLNLFKMFALASFSPFFKACLSPHPFSLPSTLYTRLYLHSLYLLSSHRSFSTRSLLALWKQPPPNIPQKTPPPTPPSVAAVLVMVLNLDVKIREGGFLFDQFLWWFSNKMWQRQGCGERVSGYLSVTFSETNEGRRVPTELWAQMAAVEKHSCTDHTVSTLGSRFMVW